MLSNDLCVLIPSLEPDRALPAYVDSLLAAGFGLILVVDDGSPASFQPIFDEVAAKPRCRVLHHERNRGKGQALRTGTAYVRDHTALGGIVTADADGQHTAPDTLKLAEQLSENGRELLLGSRDFSRRNPNVPPKSRFGNRMTSAVFKLLYGKYLPDTQTGLRAYNRALFDLMLDIEGDRFEYEMNALIRCTRERVQLRVVPIDTVYHDENKGTHFDPLRDSWRIYKLLLGSFLRFSATSILSFLLDYALLWALMRFVFRGAPDVRMLGLPLSAEALYATPLARLCSAPVNFLLNRSYAFRARDSRGAAWRYALLSLTTLVVTTFLFSLFSYGIPGHYTLKIIVKMIIDVILYFINFRIQRAWVFRGPGASKKTEAL